MSNTPAPDEFAQPWVDAHAKFKKSTGVDPSTDHLAKPMASCKTADEVLDKLDDEMEAFKDFRAEDSRWGKLRNNYIKPLIDSLLTINDAAGEAASALVSIPRTGFCFILTIIVYRDSRREADLGCFRCASPSGCPSLRSSQITRILFLDAGDKGCE
jgi:hypothetical protein